jgi:hypothetical protein
MTTLRRRCFKWQASLDGRTRIVLLAFILLAVQPLLIGELSVLRSPHKDSTVVGIVSGFVILAAILAMLLAALLRRRRWAWLVLVFLFGSAVILDVFNFNGVVRFILDVIGFALLLSPPMRRYVNRANAPGRRQGPAEYGPRAG